MSVLLNITSIFMFQISENNLGETKSKMNVAFIVIDPKIFTPKLASLSKKSLLSGPYLLQQTEEIFRVLH